MTHAQAEHVHVTIQTRVRTHGGERASEPDWCSGARGGKCVFWLVKRRNNLSIKLYLRFTSQSEAI